ncbi:hypothetical protein CKO51_09565 [Rhodopirellula sp. SM50]|nr:hypothetical protein CKO51_09565 [Rhodopirellula sp. SM50]
MIEATRWRDPALAPWNSLIDSSVAADKSYGTDSTDRILCGGEGGEKLASVRQVPARKQGTASNRIEWRSTHPKNHRLPVP